MTVMQNTQASHIASMYVLAVVPCLYKTTQISFDRCDGPYKRCHGKVRYFLYNFSRHAVFLCGQLILSWSHVCSSNCLATQRAHPNQTFRFQILRTARRRWTWTPHQPRLRPRPAPHRRPPPSFIACILSCMPRHPCILVIAVAVHASSSLWVAAVTDNW